jgi:hypothetical protein
MFAMAVEMRSAVFRVWRGALFETAEEKHPAWGEAESLE